MNGKIVEFSDGPGMNKGYLAPSATGTGPGIIVIQEWWGLVPHIMDICDRFAACGFTALAPDLFHGETTTDPDEAVTLMQALHIGETEAILRKAILVLLNESSVQPKTKAGIVGFCMGGQLAMFAAGSNPLIGAAVNFYGIHPAVQPSYRDINGPILGFFAEHDNYASPAAVKALDEELTLLGKTHRFRSFPGTHHAFFNDTRPEVYNHAAASEAWDETVQFFRESLHQG